MKRLIALLLIITYMASAIDFSFSFHYCGGKYHGVCFTSDTEKDCCGTKEKSNGCCEDKVVCAKFKEKHTPSHHAIVGKVLIESVLPAYFTHVSDIVRGRVYPVYLQNKGPSPPFLHNTPIYLYIRVLRL